MDEIKHLTNKHSYLQLSIVLQKLAKTIRTNKTEQSATPTSSARKDVVAAIATGGKEAELLQLYCLSENPQLSQLAFQTFGRLVEEGDLDAALVMSMLVSLVPGASRQQLVALSEAVIGVLLIDLKQRDAKYLCPFGLAQPQHPLIGFFQKTETNVADLVGKINGLCRHHDREIRRHSCEFLRPIYFFVFCNPSRFPDTSPLWTQLLEQSKISEPAQQLVFEVLGWCHISNDVTLLQTSTMLIDSIDRFKSDSKLEIATCELCVYLANILPDLIAHGYDPRPALACIADVLNLASLGAAVVPYLNVLLVSLCHTLPNIAPAYLTDLLRLLRHICMQLHGGNAITLRMLLSALLNWIGLPAQLLCNDCVSHLHALGRYLQGDKWRQHRLNDYVHQRDRYETPAQIRVKYFHPLVAFNVDISRHSDRLCRNSSASEKGVAVHLPDFKDLQAERPHFCARLNLYLRGMFLVASQVDMLTNRDAYVGITNALLAGVRGSALQSVDVLMTWLYQTLNESNAERLLVLLHGLAAFGGAKENIPKLIGAFKSLAQSQSGRLRPLIMKLYLQLWICEDRTFVYLKNALTASNDSTDCNNWELNVAKAKTIQEICQLKPSKHGTEMIVQLSNILNTCTTADGETATVIALQTIVGLCTSQTINVASTWFALRDMFRAERRLRPLIVQCEFFGQVPHLANASADYATCLDDALRTLWSNIASASSHIDLKVATLRALQNFDYRTLTLAQVPEEFHTKSMLPPTPKPTATIAAGGTAAPGAAIIVDDQPPPIAGDFWPHLLQLCAEPVVAEAAANLIRDYVRLELRTFRQHLYILADGHIEPQNYNRLPGSGQSPLRAIVHALLVETNRAAYERDRHMIRYALQALTAATDMPRPLPPLNWFFLVELMNAEAAGSGSEAQATRQLCLQIVVQQQLHSESARQIVENYFAAFETAAMLANDEEEFRHCMRLFGKAGRGLQAETLTRWLSGVAAVAFVAGENGFGEDSLFWALLDSCGVLFAHGNEACFGESNDKYMIVVNILSEYFSRFEEDSVIFRKYRELCVYLPETVVDRITLPMGWQSIAGESNDATRRKVLNIRQHLVEASLVRKSLRWLNAAVENTASDQQQSMLFDAVDKALRQCTDERDACLWALDLLCIIQAQLTASNAADKSIASSQTVIAMHLRLFCTVVVFRAGFDRLATNDGDDDGGGVVSEWRLSMFPESLLHVVSQLDVWRTNETRIYEFFYNVYTNAAEWLTAEFADVIRNTFMCARSRPYFAQSIVWKKIVGLRRR